MPNAFESGENSKWKHKKVVKKLRKAANKEKLKAANKEKLKAANKDKLKAANKDNLNAVKMERTAAEKLLDISLKKLKEGRKSRRGLKLERGLTTESEVFKERLVISECEPILPDPLSDVLSDDTCIQSDEHTGSAMPSILEYVSLTRVVPGSDNSISNSSIK